MKNCIKRQAYSWEYYSLINSKQSYKMHKHINNVHAYICNMINITFNKFYTVFFLTCFLIFFFSLRHNTNSLKYHIILPHNQYCSCCCLPNDWISHYFNKFFQNKTKNIPICFNSGFFRQITKNKIKKTLPRVLNECHRT